MSLILQKITMGSINEIQALWEMNLTYHVQSSTHFGAQYKDLSFSKRMEVLNDFSEDALHITLALFDNHKVGYCLSTLKNSTGELLSMHVHEKHRGKGIGKDLVKDHLKWFNDNQCTTIGVHVDCSNANTIAFYSKLGFYPNTMYLQQLL